MVATGNSAAEQADELILKKELTTLSEKQEQYVIELQGAY